ncbi:unnamed protein product [Colias eurytheme]|nr:unnamed protein product [Colias eurytheme]
MTAPGSLPLREARAVVLQPIPPRPAPCGRTTWPSRLRRTLFDPQSVRKIKRAAFRDRFGVSIARRDPAHLLFRSRVVACIESVVCFLKGGRNSERAKLALRRVPTRSTSRTTHVRPTLLSIR